MGIRRLFTAGISLLSANFVTAAFAEAPIGGASSVQNDVQAYLNRKPLPISTGGSVFQNESLRTGEASEARLVFLDSTDFSLGPRSQARLDRFVYNPDRGTGRVQIEANRGVFRFVTGTQDKKDYEVVTPSGIVRIRGTEFQLLVAKGYIIIALESGALTVTTNKGRVVPLDQPGTSLTVHSDGRVEGPKPFFGPITKYANAQFPYFVSALSPASTLATSFTSFTGCYVGVQIGAFGASGSYDNFYLDSYLQSRGGGPSFFHWSNTQHGFAAGGLSGCGYQFGPVVVGAEGEYGYDGESSSETIFGGTYTTYTCIPGVNSCTGQTGLEHTLRQTFNVSGAGRIRATVGYEILRNLLLYVAGGWTIANTNTSLGGIVMVPSPSGSPFPTSVSPYPISASNNKVVNGVNFGFGAEYAFTRNLIARVEYIYDRLTPSYNYDYSTRNVDRESVTSVKYNENTVRAALIVKF